MCAHILNANINVIDAAMYFANHIGNSFIIEKVTVYARKLKDDDDVSGGQYMLRIRLFYTT